MSPRCASYILAAGRAEQREQGQGKPFIHPGPGHKEPLSLTHVQSFLEEETTRESEEVFPLVPNAPPPGPPPGCTCGAQSGRCLCLGTAGSDVLCHVAPANPSPATATGVSAQESGEEGGGVTALLGH